MPSRRLIIVVFVWLSKWWESKYNTQNEIWTRTSPLGLGFDFSLLYGINADSVVRVSMFWLIAAYLFHTLGELCIPVGLSYVSKLVPVALIGIMFGVFYSFIMDGE
jgi:POT family proton-dependent oligopeptide transporter